MMKYLFTCLVLLMTVSFTKAQDTKEFVGKWKIVAVDNGIYYNYKNDSFFATKKFLDTLVGRKDSAERVQMFMSFATQYKNYYFIFDEQNGYKEVRDEEVRMEATYSINKADKKVEILIKSKKNDGKDRIIGYHYKFDKENLKLYASSASLNEDVELTLEKSP